MDRSRTVVYRPSGPPGPSVRCTLCGSKIRTVARGTFVQIPGRSERSKAIARRRGWLRRSRDARHRRSTDACTRTRPTMRLHRRVFQAPLLEPNGRTDGRTIVPADLRRRGSVSNTSPRPRTRVSGTQHASTTPNSHPSRRIDPSWFRPIHTNDTSLPPAPCTCAPLPLSAPRLSVSLHNGSQTSSRPLLRFVSLHNDSQPTCHLPFVSFRLTTVHNEREGDGRRQGCICGVGCVCWRVDRVSWENRGEAEGGVTRPTGV